MAQKTFGELQTGDRFRFETWEPDGGVVNEYIKVRSLRISSHLGHEVNSVQLDGEHRGWTIFIKDDEQVECVE